MSLRVLSGGIRRQFSTGFKTISVREESGVREIQLNNPKARNALSMDTMNELINGITHEQENKSLRCIVISSTGPVFSSGHNLKELVMTIRFNYIPVTNLFSNYPSRRKNKDLSSTNKSSNVAPI